MKSTDISIIIVNYNAKKFLNACLSSIFSKIRGINYEVIVVDNNSTDNSVEFIKNNFDNIKLIANKENAGYAKANNQGIEIAQGNFILLLNPDAVVFNDAIQKMINLAQENHNVGIIGCRVINPGNKLQLDSCGAFSTSLTLFLKVSGLEQFFPYNHFFGRRLMYYWQRNSSRPIDWVSGVCMLIKRKVIDDIGMLDERYFAYMEDIDFCRRAAKKKWQVFFLHNAEIFHNTAVSWKQRPEIHLFTSLISERKYFEKFYGKFGASSFKCLYLFGSFVRFFINIIMKDRRKAKDHYKTLRWLISNKI